MKRTLIVFFIVFTLFFLLPAAIVMVYSHTGSHQSQQSSTAAGVHAKTTAEQLVKEPEVTVYRSQLNRVETVPLETYIIGVVASEMPATFKVEALKAQALAARTYILRQMTQGQQASLPGKAMVTDTTANQVYQNTAELKKEWGSQFKQKYDKVAKAVEETRNQVITYKGQLITPSFFSTSNGYTENSQDYWENAVPYLQSVPSPWDKTSPKFSRTTDLTVAKIDSVLNVQLPQANGKIGHVVAYTQSHRVATIEIGGKTFTGRDIREKLGLPSTDFTMTEKGNEIMVHTKGFGHGVGMSQYGANALAGMGKSYKDILTYYYRGTAITTWKPDAGQNTLAMKTK